MSNPTSTRTDLLPVKVASDKITHIASNNRVSWIGRQVVVTLRNGRLERCEHTDGHRTSKATVACAHRLVNRLNRAAGTTTAAVEAAKATR